MLQLFREHWPRKQKALFFVHADLVEELIFALGLHPFGDHAEGQRLRRRDDRAHQRLRYRVEIHPAHEAFIQLDGVQRNTRQLRQRRIAGAEVVEMHLRAQFA